LIRHVSVRPLLRDTAWRDLIPRIEDIFFATSGGRTFAQEYDRNSFRMRWLGRYLDCFPDSFFVARFDDGNVAGYLAGCLENPALNSLFDDVEYFKIFAHLSMTYPGHLHINVDARFRNCGIGAALVSAFAEHAGNQGLAGMHVVTGGNARNAGFYARNGFEALAETTLSHGIIIFMGRRLKEA
jgi:GNAT superfamily N-acetyltransferase